MNTRTPCRKIKKKSMQVGGNEVVKRGDYFQTTYSVYCLKLFLLVKSGLLQRYPLKKVNPIRPHSGIIELEVLVVFF